MSMKVKKKIVGVFQLLRIKQYYKNIIIFIGVFFGGKLFDFRVYPQLLLAFILVCLLSSLNYIQNDIHDVEVDKIHPEKFQKRPLANGTLSIRFAWFLFIIIAAIELGFFIYFVSIRNLFALFIALIYLNGLLYNYYFKKHAFMDIISLSTIYVWRALAGCSVIGILISPWLYIIVFLTALFLAAGKRLADLRLLGEDASKHKIVYDKYSEKLLESLINLVATSLFIMYTMYCIMAPMEEYSWISKDNQRLLVYTVPFALYVIIRYLYLIEAKPSVARRTELALKDRGMVVGLILLAILIVIVLYFGFGSFEFLHLENIALSLSD